jgi:AhpD family alkylhydroperoxidase
MDHRSEITEMLARRRGMSSDAPGVMAGYERMRSAVLGEGVLERRVKELMALAVAVGTGDERSITMQVHDALESGANPEEVVEAVAVAVMMAGAVGVVHGGYALEALEQLGGDEQ